MPVLFCEIESAELLEAHSQVEVGVLPGNQDILAMHIGQPSGILLNHTHETESRKQIAPFRPL